MKNSMKLYITQDDFNILEMASQIHEDPVLSELLDEELARAEVVPSHEIPIDVVTLRSRARVLDESTGAIRELTVTMPGEPSDPVEGRVSVLSPIGSALIGLGEGQVIDWPLPSGAKKRLRVLEVVFQPEAASREGRLAHAA